MDSQVYDMIEATLQLNFHYENTVELLDKSN